MGLISSPAIEEQRRDIPGGSNLSGKDLMGGGDIKEGAEADDATGAGTTEETKMEEDGEEAVMADSDQLSPQELDAISEKCRQARRAAATAQYSDGPIKRPVSSPTMNKPPQKKFRGKVQLN